MLLDYDFLPILTVTQTSDDQDDATLFAGFVRLLRSRGYSRPRIKILPTLRIAPKSNGNAAITNSNGSRPK